ncbi:hypothetical protein [Streptomyces sp. NPDC003996]
MAADQGTDVASMIRRHSADAVRRAMSSGSWAALIRDVVQDWWREQAPRTALTVRDDMRQEDFLPLPLHLGALHETLRWCGEAAEAAAARIDVELTVQNDTLHVWLGLDRVHVRSACEDFARLLSHTLPYTDCLVATTTSCSASTVTSVIRCYFLFEDPPLTVQTLDFGGARR